MLIENTACQSWRVFFWDTV